LITLLALGAHSLFDSLFGWAFLGFFGDEEQKGAERLFVSLLLGMYAETLIAGALMFVGLSLAYAGIAAAVAMAATIAVAFLKNRIRYPSLGFGRPQWFEWAALAAIIEKLIFASWQLLRTYTFFDDALMHWSGRARSLFGGVNWSFDATSPVFMGKQIGTLNYPLLTIIWRALSAKMIGEWNDVVSRADGILFLAVIVGLVWASVWRFTKSRWFAAAAAFGVAAVPLHVWHAAAGFSDIAVEAFVLASFCALLREEMFLAGLLAAGAVWSKNDGLVLYVPVLFVTALLIRHRTVWRFLAGLATVSPWLLFNLINGLGFRPPTKTGFQWHADAPGQLWDAITASPSSGILWIFVVVALTYSATAMLKQNVGRALFVAAVLSFAEIGFVFSFTSAYEFLANQTTIHRTLMQFSAPAFLMAAYGLWLKNPAPQTRARSKKRA